MNILVIDSTNNIIIDRPYLNKYGNNMAIENSIWIGHQDGIDLVDNEVEAFAALVDGCYDSLIINACSEMDGCNLLSRLRTTNGLRHIPVTII